MAALGRSAPRRDGGGADRAPDSKARGEPTVHPSPALGELFSGVDPEGGLRVLDLGPASRRNLEHYSTFAGGVRFADLRGLAADRGITDPDDPTFGRRLGELLPLGDRSFDLVLLWDLLNYLDPHRAAVLVRHLTAVAAPGARLHAMVVTGPTLRAEPVSYQIVGPGEIASDPTTAGVVAAPDLPPAKVERWLVPFRVTRSIVLRHGVRELLAVLDEPPAAVGAGPKGASAEGLR